MDLELDDNKDNYSFDVDSDLGNVIINKRAFHNKSISNLSTNYKEVFFFEWTWGIYQWTLRKNKLLNQIYRREKVYAR